MEARKDDDQGNELIALRFQNDNGGSMYYHSSLQPLKIMEDRYVLLFLLVGMLIGIIIHRIIKFCIKYIHGTGLLDDYRPRFVPLPATMIANGYDRMFLNVLPGSIHEKFVQHKVIPTQSRIVDIQSNHGKWLSESDDRYIITHFEFGINDHEMNKKKLSFLQDLEEKKVSSVMIISSANPTAVLDFYDKKVMELYDVQLEKDYRPDFAEYKQAARAWKGILARYDNVTWALAKSTGPQDTFIESELEHGVYLMGLRKYFDKDPKELGSQNQEALTLKVQDLAQNYYTSLWNSFSNTEKYLLFDLAQDGFVNLKNINVLQGLINKGVIEVKDSLQIMNKSFNNFILSVMREDEELQMETEQQQKGTWRTIKVVIIIVLVAIATFIGFAQQGLLNNINALLGALTALATLVMRFGGIFSSTKVKDS